MKLRAILFSIIATFLLVGCANKSEPYDYTAFKASDPKSILVVMPTNSSPEVKAGVGVLAQTTIPLAESGYYVFPVALVDEIFKQNGLTNGHDIQNASIAKIHQIFGADAILYLNVSKYGTSYKVIDSVVEVSIEAKLVDLRTGVTLWEQQIQKQEGSNDNNHGLVGRLVLAAISQMINTISDKGYKVAGVANSELLRAGRNKAILYGPRHPMYKKDPQLNSQK